MEISQLEIFRNETRMLWKDILEESEYFLRMAQLKCGPSQIKGVSRSDNDS